MIIVDWVITKISEVCQNLLLVFCKKKIISLAGTGQNNMTCCSWWPAELVNLLHMTAKMIRPDCMYYIHLGSSGWEKKLLTDIPGMVIEWIFHGRKCWPAGLVPWPYIDYSSRRVGTLCAFNDIHTLHTYTYQLPALSRHSSAKTMISRPPSDRDGVNGGLRVAWSLLFYVACMKMCGGCALLL